MDVQTEVYTGGKGNGTSRLREAVRRPQPSRQRPLFWHGDEDASDPPATKARLRMHILGLNLAAIPVTRPSELSRRLYIVVPVDEASLWTDGRQSYGNACRYCTCSSNQRLHPRRELDNHRQPRRCSSSQVGPNVTRRASEERGFNRHMSQV